MVDQSVRGVRSGTLPPWKEPGRWMFSVNEEKRPLKPQGCTSFSPPKQPCMQPVLPNAWVLKHKATNLSQRGDVTMGYVDQSAFKHQRSKGHPGTSCLLCLLYVWQTKRSHLELSYPFCTWPLSRARPFSSILRRDGEPAACLHDAGIHVTP